MKATKEGANAKSPAKWNDAQKWILADCMVEETQSGVFTDNGFKSAAWNRIHEAFNHICADRSIVCNYDKQQLSSQHSTFKKKFKVFQKLLEQSGFGFNDTECLVTADPDTWVAYISSHPDAAEFKNNPFPFYHKLNIVFTGKYATGKYARSSTGQGARSSAVEIVDNADEVDDDDDDVIAREDDVLLRSPPARPVQLPLFSPAPSSGDKSTSSGGPKAQPIQPKTPGPKIQPRKRKKTGDYQTEALGLLRQIAKSPSVSANEVFDKIKGTYQPMQVMKVKKFLSNKENAEFFLSLDSEMQLLLIDDDILKL
jgi:hypothetical protein